MHLSCNYQYFIHISLNLFPVLPKLLFDVAAPCHSKRCPPYAQCVPQSRTFAVCVCPSKCRLVYDPICGTDRKSYFNLCALQLVACQSNSTVSAAYKGTCGMKIASFYFFPEFADKGTFILVFLLLGLHKSTAAFLRFLFLFSVLSLFLLPLFLSDSPTTPCARKACPPHARCVVESNGSADCVCAKSCSPSINFVCGSNGKTYSNTCELEKDACDSNRVITVSRKGFCKSK